MRGSSPRRRAPVAAVLVVAGLALGAPLVSGAEPASAPTREAAGLRRQSSVLEARSRRAVLDLYALESQLDAARSQLGQLRSETAAVRAEEALVRRQVSLTEHALAVSQRQLGRSLRTLYEQGEPDALAAILGSTSLSQAVTSIDALDQVAQQSQSVVEQTSTSRRSLHRLAASLEARRVSLATLQQQSERTAARLAQARAERERFVALLRTRERIDRSGVARLEAAAQSAAVRSQTLTTIASAAASPASIAAPAPDAVAAPAPAPAPAPTPATPADSAPTGRTITVTATGYSLPGRTATGMPVGFGVVAVDPTVIPLGTRMTVPGYGEGVAADTGGAVRGATVDLWFPTLAQARAWGRRTVTITLR